MVRLYMKALLTIKVLEVGQLDALTHAQAVERSAKTVDQHPDITSIQSRDFSGRVCARCERMLNISPGGNERADNHQPEGKQGESGDGGTAKPEDLSVSDENNGQVLEDSVHRNGQKLQSFRAGENHSDEKKSNGEP
jgi:hypothetical protein